MSDTQIASEIGTQFSLICRINRAIELSDTRARTASTTTEHYDWVQMAANLRALRTETFRTIDTLIWGSR